MMTKSKLKELIFKTHNWLLNRGATQEEASKITDKWLAALDVVKKEDEK